MRPVRLLRVLASALVLALALAACSASGGTTGGLPGAGSKGGGAVVGGKGGGAVAGGGGVPAGLITPDQVLALCRKIPTADVQTLLVPTIQKIESGPTGCAFVRPGEDANGDNLTADLRMDRDGSGYRTLSGQDDTPLPGVGDKAYWNEAVDGASAPEVTAAKGDLLCVVQTPADVGVLTIAKTGREPIFRISQAAGAAYAAKLGTVCADLFRLAG